MINTIQSHTLAQACMVGALPGSQTTLLSLSSSRTQRLSWLLTQPACWQGPRTCLSCCLECSFPCLHTLTPSWRLKSLPEHLIERRHLMFLVTCSAFSLVPVKDWTFPCFAYSFIVFLVYSVMSGVLLILCYYTPRSQNRLWSGNICSMNEWKYA